MTPTEYRRLRQRLGLTQTALAEILGIARETVTRREAGDPKNPINTEAALSLAALAQVTGPLTASGSGSPSSSMSGPCSMKK